MSLHFIDHGFDGADPPTCSSTMTSDQKTLSLLFTGLEVHSTPADQDPTPQAHRVDLTVRCSGPGWVSVQLRGAALSTRPNGYAHASARANGRRLLAQPGSLAEEPISTAATAPIGDDGLLRISVLLLAQRDLADPDSAAGCWVDSVDLVTVDPQARRAS